MTAVLPKFTAGAALLAGLVSSPLVAQTHFNQVEIAEALIRGTLSDRMAAHRMVRNLPVDKRDPSILRNLTQELNRLDEELRVRRLALLHGEHVEPSEELGEYLSSVLAVVCDYDDPAISRPLVRFLSTGNMVVNRVAGFGDVAVPDVVAAARTTEVNDDNVSSALFALQRMWASSEKPLTGESRELILDVARERLSGSQRPAVVVAAIDLAVTTRDRAILADVERLARDPQAAADVVAGTGDPSMSAHIRKKAHEALARIVR